MLENDLIDNPLSPDNLPVSDIQESKLTNKYIFQLGENGPIKFYVDRYGPCVAIPIPGNIDALSPRWSLNFDVIPCLRWYRL